MTWERARLRPGIYHVWETDGDRRLVDAIKLRFAEMSREDRLTLLMLPDDVDTERRDPLQVALPETLALETVRDFFQYDSTREVFDGLFHERLRAMNEPVFQRFRYRYLSDAGSSAWRRIRTAGRRGGASDAWGLDWLRPDAQVWLRAPRGGDLEPTVDRRGATRSVEHSIESGGYASLERQLRELRRDADELALATQGYRVVTARNAQELQALKMTRTLLQYLCEHVPDDVPAAQVERVENLWLLTEECIDAAEPVLLSEPPQTPYREMHGLGHAARELLRRLSDAAFVQSIDRLVSEARPFERDADRPAGLRSILQLTSGTIAYALRVLLESPAREEVELALDSHIRPMLGAFARAAPSFSSEAEAAIRAWEDVDPALRDGFLSGQRLGGAYDAASDSAVVQVMGLADVSENVTGAALGIYERALPALTEALLRYRQTQETIGAWGGVALRGLCDLGRRSPNDLVRLIRARSPGAIHGAVHDMEWGWLGESLPVKAFSSVLCGIALVSSLHDLSTAEGQRATARALANVFGSASEFLGSVCEVTETILRRRGIIRDATATTVATGRGLEFGLRFGRGLLVGMAMVIQARAAAEEMVARDREGDALGVFFSGVRMGASLMSAAGATISMAGFKPVGQALELAGVALEATASIADWVRRERLGGTHEVLAKYVNHFGRYAGYEDDAEGTNGPFYHLRPFVPHDARVRAFVDAFERVNGLEATPGEAGVSTTFQNGHWGVDLWSPPVVEADLAPLFDAYFTAEDLHKIFDTGTEVTWARRIGAHFHGGRAPDFHMAE